MDDFLANTSDLQKADRVISLKKMDQGFVDLQDVKIKGSETARVELTKGEGQSDLLVLMPQNKFTFSDLVTDAQSQTLKPQYKP